MMDPVIPLGPESTMEPKTSLAVTLLVVSTLVSMVTPSSHAAGEFQLFLHGKGPG